MNRSIILALALLSPAFAVAIGLSASPAQASSVNLTFGQLPNGVDILNYFNGGLSSYPPSGTGPSDGIVFSSNANEQKDTVGRTTGTGKFENNPSGVNGVLYFAYSSTTTSYLNDASGFNKLSFAYSLLNNSSTYDGTVKLYSGLSGTGTLLATLSLAPGTPAVACTARGDEFCTWSLASTSISKLAESIVFGTNATTPYTEFDNVSLSTTPLPASWTMMLTGLAGAGLFAAYRRRNHGAAAIAAA